MEEKHPAPESIVSVPIKPDYPPSEYCSSEPPPAYHRSQSAAVQVAKIIAVTVVVVSCIIGIFMVASAYVTATVSYRQLEQNLELLGEVADRFEGTADAPLKPEALIQEEPKHNKRQSNAIEEPKKVTKDINDNSIDESDSSSDSSESAEEGKPFNLPFQLDFDKLPEALIAKNQKAKMNCIVEKKRAEEVVDHQPKTVRLPFGVNLTTDPRYERLTGERMVIICESGNMQSAQPQQPEKPVQEEEDDDDDDSEQDTIMIQPVMIPIPHTAFQTHMPQQMNPMQSQEQPRPQIQIRPFHPMEAMRPPMPPMRPPMDNMRPPMEQFRPNVEQFRPNMESMRPPMPMRPIMEQARPVMEQPRPVIEQIRPMMGQPRQPIERIIAIRQNFEPVSQSLEPQRSEEVEQPRPPMMFIPQQLQIRVEAQQQPQQPQQQAESGPNPIIQHIIQEIIAQKIMESQKAAQEEQQQPQENREQVVEQPRPMPERPPMFQRVAPPRGLPIPEEVLTQLNRLPNNERVIVAVSEPESSEEDSAEDSGESQEMNNPQVPEQRQVDPEIVNRQAYMRRLPVSIPVNMMQQQTEQEPEAAASEETRPHYVQPRSVSIDEPKTE